MTATAQCRVYVAGVGAVTALGATSGDLWRGVSTGTVAIRPVRRHAMDGLSTRLGGEVAEVPRSERWRADLPHEPAIQYVLAAAEEAIGSAGVDFTRVPAARWGTVVGSCSGGLYSGRRWYAAWLAGRDRCPGDPALVSPQALAEAVGSAFGLCGPALSVSTACAAGANAIGYGADLIRSGHADVVLAGGADALSDLLFAGFNSLQSLSPEPAAPYSLDRQGLSLGEGSGMVVLVAAHVAETAGLPVLAEVRGYGISADGYHPTAPHPEGAGAARAIRLAMTVGGMAPEEIGYVNTHGTGTAKNDPAETRATRLALGGAADRARLSSTKSMIGHLLGGAGAVEGIVTVQALANGFAPPTANLRTPDPECDLDYLPGTGATLSTGAALCNNFAFGGANASLLLARGTGPAEDPPPPDTDRVVITGLAAQTCAGTGTDALWAAVAGARAVLSPEGGRLVGRVDPVLPDVLPARATRRMDRLGVLAVAAAASAARDAGLTLDGDVRHRVGAVVGTCAGPIESLERFAEPVIRQGVGSANPAVFPNTVYNAAGGQVAMHVGALGPASTVTAGHAAGAAALAYGYDLVATGRADAMICLGVDTLTPAILDAYAELGLLADGTAARRRRLNLSEAGAAVVVERYSAARARGARILGEIRGHGCARDNAGFGRHDRHGGGVERAMRAALRHAGMPAGDVATVWLNRCGHPVADLGEDAAVPRVVPGARRRAVKEHLGEPLGAWGVLGTILAVLDFARAATPGPALVNSLSLGGTSVCLALSPA